MDSRILIKKGFSVLEAMVAVAILSMLFSMITENAKTRINKAMLERTVNEMMSIAQESIDFYNSKGNWPVDVGELCPTYMASVSNSPFGGKYQINNLNNAVSVSTNVPSGLAEHYYQGDLLEILPGTGLDKIDDSTISE